PSCSWTRSSSAAIRASKSSSIALVVGVCAGLVDGATTPAASVLRGGGSGGADARTWQPVSPHDATTTQRRFARELHGGRTDDAGGGSEGRGEAEACRLNVAVRSAGAGSHRRGSALRAPAGWPT